MIKTNQTDEGQAVGKFQSPPDPFDRWNEPVTIIDTRKRIHFQPLHLFPSEGKGLLGRIQARFLTWLSKNAD